MSVAEKVSDLVSPLCSSANVELVDIELNGGVLKIVIDQSEGLNTEVLADMTREISRQLDHEEPIPGSYTLEVTSPGLERPLKKPQHFEKAVGSLITLKKVEGILKSSSSSEISIELEDGSLQEVPYEIIQKARTVFVWQPESESFRSFGEKEKIIDGRIEQ